jgi:hypothetical protein
MIAGPLLSRFGTKPSIFEKSSISSGDMEEEYSIEGYAVILTLSSMYFLCSAATLRFLRGTEEIDS